MPNPLLEELLVMDQRDLPQRSVQPKSVVACGTLELADYRGATATCYGSDPGPDETYDEDHLPDEVLPDDAS